MRSQSDIESIQKTYGERDQINNDDHNISGERYQIG